MRRTDWLLWATLCALFGIAGYFRASPFVDDVSSVVSAGDDWLTYKNLAESVVNDGVAMRGLSGAFGAVPHGFLYIYFLALIFAIAGVNAAYAYVVQSALLGLSIGIMYSAFRRTLPLLLGLLFLLALIGLAYIDVFRVLSFRLLSENLYFPLAAMMWLAVTRERPSAATSAVSGLLLGLTVLTRPSTIMGAGLVFAILAMQAIAGRRGRGAAMLALGFAIGLAPATLRDWFVTGHVGFQLVSNTHDWIRIWNAPLPEFLAALGRRTAFAFGWTSLMQPAFSLRPHWLALWALAALYVPLKIIRRESFSAWEWMLGLYICAYIGPVVLVADIASYGGRMIATILPAVAVFAIGTLRLQRIFPPPVDR